MSFLSIMIKYLQKFIIALITSQRGVAILMQHYNQTISLITITFLCDSHPASPPSSSHSIHQGGNSKPPGPPGGLDKRHSMASIASGVGHSFKELFFSESTEVIKVTCTSDQWCELGPVLCIFYIHFSICFSYFHYSYCIILEKLSRLASKIQIVALCLRML